MVKSTSRDPSLLGDLFLLHRFSSFSSTNPFPNHSKKHQHFHIGRSKPGASLGRAQTAPGQSNMAGRGGVYNDSTKNIIVWDGVIPPECRSNPSILRLTAKLEWEEAKEPLHADIDVNKTNGVGPGMSFANLVVNRFDKVGLVPCSVGGTKLSQWQKGEFLYEETVKRAKSSSG
ncbi:hypothetical protein YC2023_044792 [Brassica napus]